MSPNSVFSEYLKSGWEDETKAHVYLFFLEEGLQLWERTVEP